MSMDDVVADEQRNPQPRFLDRQILHFTHVFHADQIQQVADGAALDRFRGIAGDGGTGHGLPAGRHGELAEFFGQRHLAY